MEQAWKTLTAAGVPDGAPRSKPAAIDFGAVRAALSTLELDELDGVTRVALLAWLEGWSHHWPSRYARELGEIGERLRSRLAARPFDANRYLKLRRIAVENLGAVL